MDAPFWNGVLGNAVMATALALAALGVRRFLKQPRLEHFVWVLVLVKLFTPAIAWINVPVLESVADTQLLAPGITGAEAAIPAPAAVLQLSTGIQNWEWCLLIVWASGSLLVWLFVARRSRAFRRLLEQATPASALLVEEVFELAEALRVRLPRILLVRQTISPLLTWQGRKLVIVLPDDLMQKMNGEARRAILAHELAHIARRDHLVRLLELLASVCFWWHPVTWLAKRRLQECGELCCDAHVLATTNTRPRQYAGALLETMDWLAGRRVRLTWGETAATGNLLVLTRRFEMLRFPADCSRGKMFVAACLAAVLGCGLAWGVTLAEAGSPLLEVALQQPAQKFVFHLSETDAAGTETVHWNGVTILSMTDASVSTESGHRKYTARLAPVANTRPRQWRVEFQMSEGGEVLIAPVLILNKSGGSVQMSQPSGEKLEFRVDVK